MSSQSVVRVLARSLGRSFVCSLALSVGRSCARSLALSCARSVSPSLPRLLDVCFSQIVLRIVKSTEPPSWSILEACRCCLLHRRSTPTECASWTSPRRWLMLFWKWSVREGRLSLHLQTPWPWIWYDTLMQCSPPLHSPRNPLWQHKCLTTIPRSRVSSYNRTLEHSSSFSDFSFFFFKFLFVQTCEEVILVVLWCLFFETEKACSEGFHDPCLLDLTSTPLGHKGCSEW